MDAVFKALADKSRRKLLDSLCEKSAQTLGDLCSHLAMSRQAVMKHLGILEKANLITIRWDGREKLHYLNPAPIQETYGRWISKYEQQHARALDSLKLDLEEKKEKPTNKKR